MYGEKINANDSELFNDVVNGILSVMGGDAVKIILYGSVARGDNTPESDVDIAVLTTKYYDWQARAKIYDAIWEYDMKYETLFQVVPIPEVAFNELKDEKLFYRNILKDGITLWTKNAA